MSHSPAAVARSAPAVTLGSVAAVAAGAEQTCALLDGGSVDCWGENSYGQLGDATSSGPRSCNGNPCASTPTPVHAITNATAISAGGEQTCALLEGGSIDCWGENNYGQLGDATSSGPRSCNGNPCASTPTPVHAITNATAISAGGDQTCALLAGGSIECWGENNYGQLGDGVSSGPQSCNGNPCASTPTPVHAITNATAISAGGDHACALLAGGSIDCWGENNYGQLGDGVSRGPQSCNGNPCASTPTPVRGITNATAISAGGDHACALLAGGSIDCWGYNFAAALGIGTSSGPQWCSGGEWCSTKPVGVVGLASATAIVAGGDHSCALVIGGEVDCWGYNSYGQLGDGVSTGPQTCYWNLVRCAKTPVAVASIADAVAVAAGGDHTCALLRSGSVDCWGENWFGDLGDGVAGGGPDVCNGYPCSATPVAVSRQRA